MKGLANINITNTKMDWNNPLLVTLLTTLISTSIPSIITALFSLSSRKQAKLHSAKQSILQMIMEDRMRVEMYHHLPENYQAVMMEFDAYTKAGGNSYVHDRVMQYEEWYKNLVIDKEDK